MPRATESARDVCSGCGRGVRADRLDGRRCFDCRLRGAVAGLPPAEARRARDQAEAREWQREAELQRGSPRLYCPRCRRQRVRQWLSDEPLCLGCQVQLAVRGLAEHEAAEGARRAARPVPAPRPAPARRRSLSERASAWLWGSS